MTTKNPPSNSFDISSDSSITEKPARFIIGIDLGTTNSAVAYLDTQIEPYKIESFSILQIIAPHFLERRLTLPSFFCQASGLSEELPWKNNFLAPNNNRSKTDSSNIVVGTFARDFGNNSLNYVASAKSWLSHSGVDRTSKILPWFSSSEKESLENLTVPEEIQSPGNKEKQSFGKTPKANDLNVSNNDVCRKDPLSLRKWSPVEISSFYLSQIRNAWNDQYPDFRMEDQDIVLTLPASFDEVARELTIQAAKQAGLSRITLIEEPQAAFYSWIYAHENDWESLIEPGQKILVCDIGGGTTDLTLIRVRQKTKNLYENETEQNETFFHRIAVGEHLILGGDNFDLAIAHHLENRLIKEGKVSQNGLSSKTWKNLIRQSCQIKEQILSDDSLETIPVTISGLAGSKLIAGSRTLTVSRSEIEQIVIDGFFPKVSLNSKPDRQRLGFQEFGLPYAKDPAITKHLAHFLVSHRFSGENLDILNNGNNQNDKRSKNQQNPKDDQSFDHARPDIILFNGGVFRSPKLQKRIINSIECWFNKQNTDQDSTIHSRNSEESLKWSPQILKNDNLDLAVSRGAVYYGMVRRGSGIRISASLARTYYIGVNTQNIIEKKSIIPSNQTENISNQQPQKPIETTQNIQALCLIPASFEPGEEIVLKNRSFDLIVGNPVSFPIFVSSVRLTDEPGEFYPIQSEEMKLLPEIQTILKTRSKAKREAKTVLTELAAHLTELGTIELYLREIPRLDNKRRLSNWKLQFDVRSATQTDIPTEDSLADHSSEILDESILESIRVFLTEAFQPQSSEKISPSPSIPVARTKKTQKNQNSQQNVEQSLPIKPSEILKKLSEIVELKKEEFPLTLLRRIGEILLELQAGRQKGPAWESRWLNLSGFAFRPGFGVPMDDWRIEQLRKTLSGNILHPTLECRTQNWILWRRIASGLSKGQQQTLLEPLIANIRNLHRQITEGRGKGADIDLSTQEGAEIWRLIGSAEKIPIEWKIELGNLILDMIDKKRLLPVKDVMIWSLGRIGARTMFHAPLNAILSPHIVENWILRLLQRNCHSSTESFTLMQLSRKTNDRSLDISEKTRDKVLAFLIKSRASERLIQLVTQNDSLQEEETKTLLGDSLPLGLLLSATDPL
ncbi:MAG: Hsp70 family protein [Planctomycetia bacterium]|nr:Hsp70 family protein [Planctomycetia bacterium]